MCWGASQAYASDVRAPAAGRQFCAEQLRTALTDRPGRDDLIDDAVLVVSELLTNSLRAQSRVARLSLALHRDLLRIVVDDDAPGQPRVRTAASIETTGRGMAIVASLASAWSVERLIPGKQVWAELDVPPELTVDLPSCHRPTRFQLGVQANPPGIGKHSRPGPDADTSETPTVQAPAGE